MWSYVRRATAITINKWLARRAYSRQRFLHHFDQGGGLRPIQQLLDEMSREKGQDTEEDDDKLRRTYELTFSLPFTCLNWSSHGWVIGPAACNTAVHRNINSLQQLINSLKHQYLWMVTWPYQREVWWDEYPERAVFVIDNELYFEERVIIIRSPDAGEYGP